MIKIGLLGFGTVGEGFYRNVMSKRELIKDKTNKDFMFKRILVKDLSEVDYPEVADKLTEDYESIINDPEIDLIVEVIGGTDLAYDLVIKALKNKKSVITANKALVSKHFKEFVDAAKENGVSFQYEASVAGGVPIIEGIKNLVNYNSISKVKGILNGTTNFILSKMFNEDAQYDKALSEAQELGFAEADPTDDVEGFDVQRKLAILSTLCFGSEVKNEQIYTEGISRISKDDIDYAKKNNKVIKLIAEASLDDGKLSLAVEPKFVDLNSTFANVEGSFNIVSVDCDLVGNLQYYGKGAGDLPTGNAVAADMIRYMENVDNDEKFNNSFDVESDDAKFDYYLRISDKYDNEKLLSEVKNRFGDLELIYENSLYQCVVKNASRDMVYSLKELDEKNQLCFINME
ncbi:MAG: homoserine dehydrogenase [Firmicutes bacterium]|nr:homoserine dehydrogenase [Bacillota bacterium]